MTLPARNLAALAAFIDSRHAVPHAWGREANDCIGFGLAAIEAATGQIVAPRIRWTSRATALRTIKRFGSLEAALDAHFERVPAAFALPGDLAAVVGDLGPLADGFDLHPMVVEGRQLVGPGENGNRRVKRQHMVFAWSATGVKV